MVTRGVPRVDPFTSNYRWQGAKSHPITISIRFTPPANANPYLAQIETIDPTSGHTQVLPTAVTANSDGTFTATAQTSHLSSFVVFAPGPGTSEPVGFIPAVAKTAGGW